MSKKEKKRIRNQKIINTAEKLIKQKGYHHFKMSDISDELEIAKGTIYNHYSSKEDLLFELIYPKLESLRNNLKLVNESKNLFEEKFRMVISEAIESDYHQFVLLSFPDVAALFQERNQHKMESIQEEIIQEFNYILDSGLNEGVIREDISIEFLSHQILSSLNPLLYSLLVNDSSKMTHEEFIKQTTQLLLNGIKRG